MTAEQSISSDNVQRVLGQCRGVKAFLRSRLGSEEEAEDALQEILYNLFRTSGDNLDSITNIPAWMYRAARNLLSNLSRRQPFLSYDDGEMLLDMLVDAGDPEADMLRQMFWEELDIALGELPEGQRDVWKMTELEGIPVSEIARMTDIPQATLLSRKHYAVKHLRKKLQQLYYEIINQ